MEAKPPTESSDAQVSLGSNYNDPERPARPRCQWLRVCVGNSKQGTRLSDACLSEAYVK